jgi:predicted nucleotidyltransferase
MSLIQFLKTDENSRKIFGKQELKIIERQLNGINLTQSEKNRLSRDIRPKLDFVRRLAKFEDEFILKKNQRNKELIQRTIHEILQDDLGSEVRTVLLFGSLANNEFTNRSDIDICVVFKKEITLKEATQFRIRVSGKLPEKIDIQVFNVLPFKIKKSIAENHRVLYKSGEFDNVSFSVRYLKDNDYFSRLKKTGFVENEPD